MATRRPAGLKTQAARDEFDSICRDLDVQDDDKHRRREVARVAAWRERGEALLAADRQSSGELMLRRADRALSQLRRACSTAPAPPGSNARAKWLARTFTDGVMDARDDSDEDVSLFATLLCVRGHWNELSRAERAWALGETTARPSVAT